MNLNDPRIWFLVGLCCVCAIALTSCAGDGDGLTEAGDPLGAEETVVIAAAKDNTLYENATGALSNGVGSFLFVGKTGQAPGISLRRTVIAFDIAGNVPAGATVTGATLTLNVSNMALGGGGAPSVVELHRILADWGEGTSNAGPPGGRGTAATTGDATWIHTFFNTGMWAAAGGDFSPTVSASKDVDDFRFHSWSGAQMVADVESWLDTPADNFGWIIIGNETDSRSARRFDSRENPDMLVRPQLRVTYRQNP